MTNKCRIDHCKEPVYGALHMPVWKTDENGKIITKGKFGSAILEGYELWYYCKSHHEIFSFVDNQIDKIIGKT